MCSCSRAATVNEPTNAVAPVVVAPLAGGCYANRVLASAYDETASAQARQQLAQLNRLTDPREQQAFVRYQSTPVPRNPNPAVFVVPPDRRRLSVPNAHGRPLRPCCGAGRH